MVVIKEGGLQEILLGLMGLVYGSILGKHGRIFLVICILKLGMALGLNFGLTSSVGIVALEIYILSSSALLKIKKHLWGITYVIGMRLLRGI